MHPESVSLDLGHRLMEIGNVRSHVLIGRQIEDKEDRRSQGTQMGGHSQILAVKTSKEHLDCQISGNDSLRFLF